MRFDIRKIDRNIDNIKTTIDQRVIRPLNDNNQHNKSQTNRQSFLKFDTNLRSMLSAYHMGTGPLDIVKSLSMMGLGVDQSYERSFYRYMKTINLKIISTCENIIEESLIAEVSATIKEVSDNQDLTPERVSVSSLSSRGF